MKDSNFITEIDQVTKVNNFKFDTTELEDEILYTETGYKKLME